MKRGIFMTKAENTAFQVPKLKDNQNLRDAVGEVRSSRSNEALARAVDLLMEAVLILPVSNRSQGTEPGQPASLSPYVISNDKGMKFFPFFTSTEEMHKFFGKQKTDYMPVSIERYLPILLSASKDISGLVLDPASLSYPFPTGFLESFHTRYVNQKKAEKSGQRLLEALKQLKKKKDNKSYMAAAQALIDAQVYVPGQAQVKAGKAGDTPDAEKKAPTPILPMIVSNQKGEKLFPFFTSVSQMREFVKDPDAVPLQLTSDQFMPLLLQTESQIKGAVIDPSGINMAFDTAFLKEFNSIYGQKNPSNLQKKESHLNLQDLQDPAKRDQQLEAALISGGYHIPEISSIYLKERKDAQSGKTSWIVLINAEKQDPAIFEKLAEIVRKVPHSRQIEFAFLPVRVPVFPDTTPLYQKF